MTDHQDVLSAIDDFFRQERWADCARVCQDALVLELSENDWYTVRATLAAATSRMRGTDSFEWFVESAIRGMTECSERFSDLRRSQSLRSIAFLFSHRTERDGVSYRAETIEHYRSAVIAMEAQSDADLALTLVSFGIALLQPARTLTTDDIAEYGNKVDLATAHARDAIAALEKAMRLFESSGDEEQREDAAAWITSAHGILNKLELKKDTLH